MFRHQGKKRTLAHNLQLAKFLSLVAGMVVVRTTHLTGLFTDLDIELSNYFFQKSIKEKNNTYHQAKNIHY